MTGRLSLLLLGLAAYALLLFSSFAVAANHAPVAVGGGNDEVQDVPGAPLAGEETVDPASRRDITFADDAVGAVARSPWFGLASGLASIIALLVTLYSTQIRGLPFSMYRSLTWRRMLLFALGVGLLVVSGINFYFQWPPPGIQTS